MLVQCRKCGAVLGSKDEQCFCSDTRIGFRAQETQKGSRQTPTNDNRPDPSEWR